VVAYTAPQRAPAVNAAETEEASHGPCQLYILTEGGEIIERRIRTEPDRFAAVLGPRRRARILIEASTESEWVARCLERLGHEVIVGDPNFAPMYATRSRKVKTDRRDARALAEACVLGAYRPAHRLSDAQRHVRGRLGVRDALVRTRTRYIALIRALLRQHGYRVPSGSAQGFLQRVRDLPLPGRLLSVIAPLLAVMRHLNRQLAYSDTTIEHLAAQDPRVPRLRSVPCVGPVTAAAFLAAVDDAQRFHHAHELEAYLGLVPREYSSGESQRRGPITKAGHSRTRWLLIQAAVSLLRRHPPQVEALRTWALRIAARRGRQVVVVALARRLAGILYALLRDGSVFDPHRVPPPRPAAVVAPA
jgi:transposase